MTNDPARVHAHIAARLGCDDRLVAVADYNGALCALVVAELVAELRLHRQRPVAESASEADHDADLERLVHAAAEVLGDRSFGAAELIGWTLGDTEHRIALRLAVLAFAGVAPGEDVSAQTLGTRLAAATAAGPRRFGALVLERLPNSRTGSGRWRVVEAADAADA